MNVPSLDKTEVARRQLGAALALFLDDLDPVSVHTLALAGGEIAEHLSHKGGNVTFASHAMATFPDLNMKELRRLQRQYWNAFKHALSLKGEERDDQKLFERFSDLKNDHALFVGWYDYMQAAKVMPVEAQAFQVWYFALYPDKLAPSADRTVYEVLFSGLHEKPRGDQKKALREAIEKARADATVMSDPQTERRPLMLPA